MKLVIVIPALNEEQSIENIISRTFDAKNHIISKGNIDEVEIVVVSDGSTDGTVSLASKHLDKIKLIEFKENKGYGAAIKTGWQSSPSAELLAFIDADGTCDPNFFANLCDIITTQKADIALGNRLHKESNIPLVRRIGNIAFSILLSSISKQPVKDTASGMRVIRASRLKEILPLPDGLNFTPCMSARAILSGNFKIVETNMPYSEREGKSKLKLWKDGKNFLKVILSNIFLYVPFRVFNIAASFLFLFSVVLMATPISFYLSHASLEDWMIYRFIVSIVLSIIGVLLLSISSILYNIIHITLQPDVTPKKNLLYYIFEHSFSIILGLALMIMGTLLISNSIISRLKTGHTNEHWSRYITMIFFYLTGSIIILTYFVNRLLNLVKERLIFLNSSN